MALINFDGVTFQYGDSTTPVINNFSASIGMGQKVAIKADSGTGKTTLLRLLLGFEELKSGDIRYQGTSIASDNFATIRKATAWLPQDLNIGDGTVGEVIDRIFEFQYNRSKKPGGDQIKSKLSLLGLSSSLLPKPFRELSTGQRQRVGLVLCHLLDRPLMLLDEPTSALDEDSKQKAIDLLFSDNGQTIISTTHDPFWLERCDKIIELK
ncbi:ABC transporter ATP-binding protein [Aliifodinibius sp. S!AR15-10]|uniref:ABC transporter ATP-binding protein n=1 Tax=Aliifodinibius sp. S!AR15-10 TaxID=2950437 RepID=UPI0028659E21|nr:ABC transporter ATP-binding protein [Aliifodinibius sp. S!AR15-10]MDR8391229.1 ABC transporter ATP-binding protein [Aliifodinibius sp. S!AR15-10]